MKEGFVINRSIFDFYYYLAVLDATKRVSKAEEKEALLKKPEIKTAILTYAENVINNNGNPDFYCTLERIKKISENKLSFGKIQKLINMTMKYLYSQFYYIPECRERFKKCHAPMDRKMLHFVYVKYKELFEEYPGFSRDLSWSKMTERKIYDNYQNAIRRIIENENKDLLPIEFDYVALGKDPHKPLNQFA